MAPSTALTTPVPEAVPRWRRHSRDRGSAAPTAVCNERVFDTLVVVDRRHELENLRRSLAMLTPGAKAVTREEAMLLFQELGEVRDRLNRLRRTLRQLAEED